MNVKKSYHPTFMCSTPELRNYILSYHYSLCRKKNSDRAKDEGILQEALLIVVDLLKLTATQLQGYSKGKGNNHKLEKLQLFFKVSFLAENLSALVSSCLNFRLEAENRLLSFKRYIILYR